MNAIADACAATGRYWLSPFDARALRNVLGSCPTGVAIVATRAARGRPVGPTVNSFASLSLDPPLVLWSLSNRSSSMDAFCAGAYFSINVLAAGQEDLARVRQSGGRGQGRAGAAA